MIDPERALLHEMCFVAHDLIVRSISKKTSLGSGAFISTLLFEDIHEKNKSMEHKIRHTLERFPGPKPVELRRAGFFPLSIRKLADDHNINPATARRCVEDMVQLNLIQTDKAGWSNVTWFRPVYTNIIELVLAEYKSQLQGRYLAYGKEFKRDDTNRVSVLKNEQLTGNDNWKSELKSEQPNKSHALNISSNSISLSLKEEKEKSISTEPSSQAEYLQEQKDVPEDKNSLSSSVYQNMSFEDLSKMSVNQTGGVGSNGNSSSQKKVWDDGCQRTSSQTKGENLVADEDYIRRLQANQVENERRLQNGQRVQHHKEALNLNPATLALYEYWHSKPELKKTRQEVGGKVTATWNSMIKTLNRFCKGTLFTGTQFESCNSRHTLPDFCSAVDKFLSKKPNHYKKVSLEQFLFCENRFGEGGAPYSIYCSMISIVSKRTGQILQDENPELAKLLSVEFKKRVLGNVQTELNYSHFVEASNKLTQFLTNNYKFYPEFLRLSRQDQVKVMLDALCQQWKGAENIRPGHLSSDHFVDIGFPAFLKANKFFHEPFILQSKPKPRALSIDQINEKIAQQKAREKEAQTETKPVGQKLNLASGFYGHLANQL